MKPMVVRYFFLAFPLLLIISCSPEKRLARLMALHPGLKASDTLLVLDTFLIPFVQADTILHINSLFDTVVIEKDRLQVSVLRLHDTLYLQGKCKTDTIFLEKKVPFEKIVIVKPDRFDSIISKIPWLVSGLIAVSIFLIVLFLRIRH